MTSDDTSNDDSDKGRKLVLDDKAVKKDFDKLPGTIRDQFLVSLEMVRLGLTPALRAEKLRAVGNGVWEMKINGSPAWRCMYVVRNSGDVVVLHATSKTTQGQDKRLVKTTTQRLRRLLPDK